jgi:PAS domain S-box-containing protein
VVRFYSANVEQVLGYPPAAWYENDALWVKGIHPDDRDRAVKAHDELRDHGTTLDIEYRFVKPNGEVVWIEDRARLERGPDGRPRMLRGTNADVTERKRLEERLLGSESEARALYRAALAVGEEMDPLARLERVLDATLELIGVTQAQIALLDPDSETIEVVAARGDTVRDLHLRIPFGQGLYSIVIGENRPLRIADMQADPRTFRSDLAAAQQAHAWLAVPLTDSAGASGALGVVSHEPDVFTADHERLLVSLAALASAAVRESRLRERLAEAEALRELARLKDEFLSTVSHELRTPLSLVCGYSELLLTRPYPADQTLEVVAEISLAAKTMARLVDDLLDLGRVERGELHLNLTTIDVASELHDAARRHAGQSGEHELRVEAEAGLPKASADLIRNRQVLDNLVENALRYAVPGPVVLRAKLERNMLRVEVEDSGPGIPAELTSRVFEKFYRSPDARLSRERGTGIGLAVVKQLVEAQGGEAGVCPSPNGGSIFWYSLNTAG